VPYFKTPLVPPTQNQNLQWERFSLPVGQDLFSRSPTTGFQIANIQIDNTSGSWLTINPGNFLVPPYTLGWATNLIPSANSVDVIYTDGPAGLSSSTSAGSPINISLYNEPLGNLPGSQYISTETSILSIYYNGLAGTPAGQFATLLPAIVGNKYRFHSLTLRTNDDSAVNLVLVDVVSGTVLSQLITNNTMPMASISYPPPGLDATVSSSIQIDFQALWKTASFWLVAVYSVV
jgi:hypothetical protein